MKPKKGVGTTSGKTFSAYSLHSFFEVNLKQGRDG